MKNITYLFWRLFKYFNRIGWGEGSYGRSVICFSLPYNIPLLIVLLINIIPFIKGSNVNEEYIDIIVFILFLPIFFLLTIPIRLLFPKSKIYSMQYSKEEIKKYNYNIIKIIAFIFLLLILMYFFNR